ncbi:type I polyketide synthase [Terracidiphilus gabretensis]|uniref:type I polyketide synthase n=1 Tax=Terracidiphilus gabretensis TaxID=1577687 RepID=UPI00071B1F9A|nr:beta-ketoacyl synthase N-terminal-like domain-containing protein [Terracidiphilus gabretensis]
MNYPDQPREPLSPVKLAFLKLQEAEARIRELEAEQSGPIAIVGIGCRFPDAEEGPDSYWRLLSDRHCAISDGMQDRLRTTDGVVQLPDSARGAALLKQVDLFDPQHFGISPREAAAMDPQQRLLLEVSWEALEHAGIDPFSLYQTRAGVYIGITSHDYAQLQTRGGNLKELHPHSAVGVASSIAAGRIAYTLGLHGPAISIDTACSSSLVAVHLASEALRRQECSMALAGGVNLILAPEASVAFAQAGMLSASGTCAPFLSSADGFVRGEGCGIVVLKRLKDSEAAGDRILAVILGSAVNQDGPSSGLTAPNGLAQQALLREAHRRAGIAPEEVRYVEAHGTGTKLGDPVESEALGAVFAGRSEKLAIGSVKANVGHLEAAAGVAGLIKLVLSLVHGEIPGQLMRRGLSEYIRWDELPLELPAETSAWMPIAGRRIGGVSSFGFSGTNAHVVVEGWSSEEDQREVPEGSDVLMISARTEGSLRRLAEKYSMYLRETTWNWSEICHTASVGRAALAERLAVVAGSRDEAAEKLSDWLSGKAANGVYRGHVKAARRGNQGQTDELTPEAFAELFAQGGDVNWKRRGAGKGLRRAELPIYPFERERYWFKERSLDREEAPMISLGSTEAKPHLEDLRFLLTDASDEERLGIIRNFLRGEIAKVLEMNVSAELREDKPLAEMGMDSLMALELKHSVQQSSGVMLPANFMFEYPTIQQAAAYLNAMIGSNQKEPRSLTHSADYEDIAL